MADFSVTIPDEEVPRVTEALCKGAGLEVSVENAKQAIINHIKTTVTNVERTEALSAAQTAIPDITEPSVS